MDEAVSSRLLQEKVVLVQDIFGSLAVNKKQHCKVERFTWYNRNRIQVQVITYGARITSIRTPCRRGVVEDILMGFDTLSDYVNRELNNFGATLGRFAGPIEGGTFLIDGKQHWVTQSCGFQNKVFTPYVDKTKLILSYVSQDGEQGYPGTLLLRITYELSPRNEFRVDMEAFSTQPTIVNLTDSLYFNLGGHGSGAKEMRRHYIAVNANCYTVENEEEMPSGEIRNVINTEFDLQIPKLVAQTFRGKRQQFLCVNRGVQQGECFVASLFHPLSGRLLEIYSDQPGVNVSLPENLGIGIVKAEDGAEERRVADAFDILGVIYGRAKQVLGGEEAGDLSVVRDLTRKLYKRTERNQPLRLNDKQIAYLNVVRESALDAKRVPVFAEVAELIENILVKYEDGRRRAQAIDQDESGEQKCRTPKRFLGRGGAVYANGGAICLQTQNYPDAPRHSNFPNCILRPGEAYRRSVVYKFWIKAGNPARLLRSISRELSKDDSTTSWDGVM